ncbi:MAG TPA: FAD-binding and (Fe-S)-binding domain-containing protein, partial [Kofleriaceae bacterium]|nr:FAD-binding and (Fe-S)-binding domain-containing protein [Kofleriaceae bacterium]
MPSDLIGVKRSPLAAALARQVDGEVGFDRGTRAAFATDASNYRQPPLGVVFPRTIDALVSAVQICHEHGAPIVARGGGTSLAGQTCNEAVVIDCSRHLSKVEIDRERGVAQVEPGAIMASLRARANEAGWEFGPDPSTHDRCTLGGMLGNNSCGVHSVLSEFYGPGPRTSDHVELLDVITYDGERLRLGAELPASDRIKRTFVLFSEVEELVRERYPRIPRCSSGYNLIDLLPERGAHLGRALVGSESTLVMIAGAELRLIPAKPARVLVVIGFSDIFAAAAAAPRARERRPSGCEAFDDTLHDRMRHQHRDPHHALELLPEGRSWLFIEHAGETLAEARAEAHITAHRIRGTGVAIYSDPRAIAALADMREQALGVDAFATGRPDTHEGWEDASVHPDRLEPYLRAFRALLDEHQLHGSLYGHFGQGCVHTRIDFDLHSDAGIARYRRFTEDAARLVVSFGGSYSGEHGDGQSKAELHEIMFGPELVAAFGKLKQIWDPDGGMNPGKLVRPNPRTANLRLRDFHPPQWSANGEHREPHGVGTLPASPVGRGRSPRGIDIQLHHGPDGFDFAHATVRCVGIGKCRKLDAGTMCPSYMVTRDERHSTRGRAHLLHEMLRGEIITDGWRSDEVREALDLCLACKACKHECPTGVDLASY